MIDSVSTAGCLVSRENLRCLDLAEAHVILYEMRVSVYWGKPESGAEMSLVLTEMSLVLVGEGRFD